MFHRLSITKRIVAACGIALTMLGSLQHAHVFCQMTGCSRQIAAEGSASCCQRAAKAKATCRNLCSPNIEQSAGVHITASCGAGSHGPACPSPGNCVCCQEPPTLSQTSPVDVEALATASADCGYWLTVMNVVDAAAFAWQASASQLDPDGSLDTCVRLCRFLA